MRRGKPLQSRRVPNEGAGAAERIPISRGTGYCHCDDDPLGEAFFRQRPARPHRDAVAAIAPILFNPIWTTLRFSALFDRFLWMQLAVDESYYFRELAQQITDGSLDVNYRLFSKLLAAALLPLGISFDTLVTIYGLLNPLLAFGAALVLATT